MAVLKQVDAMTLINLRDQLLEYLIKDEWDTGDGRMAMMMELCIAAHSEEGGFKVLLESMERMYNLTTEVVRAGIIPGSEHWPIRKAVSEDN